MGIFPTKSNLKYSFNSTSFFILTSLIIAFLSSAAFFFWGSESDDSKRQSEAFKQETFYVSSTNSSYIVCSLVNSWKITTIIKHIGKTDAFIQRSK